MIRKLLTALILFLFISFGCSNNEETILPDNPPSSSINKIMPLGASRVDGARPSCESYRYELWERLVDGGIDC